MFIILHNIRSAHNVGAIFRTADATGVQELFLTGYTPSPIDRFGRVREEIKKTSLGATETVVWSTGDINEIISKLKSNGTSIIGIEQTPVSVSLKNFVPNKQVAYILGNETEGIDEATLAQCDVIVELPMVGKKESLNVAVTAGIVMYHDLFSKQ